MCASVGSALRGGCVIAQQASRAVTGKATALMAVCRATQESYAALNKKTLAFFGTAAGIYEADYIIKVDDDAFLRLDRLPHAVGQWRQLGAGAHERLSSAVDETACMLLSAGAHDRRSNALRHKAYADWFA